MSRRDLLLEVGLEEMPARFMPAAIAQLAQLATAALAQGRLDFSGLKTYGTPRRLALMVFGLATRQQAISQKVRGPAVKAAYDAAGNPTKALTGFARSQGVAVGDLSQGEVKGALYVFAEKQDEGQGAEHVLPQLLSRCLHQLDFPKTMRWGSGQFRFARPVRWLLALWGDQVLPLEFAGQRAGASSWGHRFLAPEPLLIAEPGEYLAALEKGWVIVDQERRREIIRRQAEQLAADCGGSLAENPELLAEVVQLVEYPTAFCGRIEAKYMQLPAAVLTTSMQVHQRYFPIIAQDGGLLPGFIAVRNGGKEHLDSVRAGNESVLRARLEDAAFFWAEDLKQPLAARRPALDRLVYLEGLGSVGDKVMRLVELTGWLGEQLKIAPWTTARAQRAASLAKSDLVTLMVNEFPELQGKMGEKYALAAGEEQGVARAIAEHYQPRFAGDLLPTSTEGALLAIADRIDNICGSFIAGLIPTGSQDPYALRRQAQAICTIAIEKQLALSLPPLVAEVYRLYAAQFAPAKSLAVLQGEALDFFAQRLQYSLSEAGVSYDVIAAVLSAGAEEPLAASRRARALAAFRQEQGFAALLTAYSRAANLAEKVADAAVAEQRLAEPAEKELWAGVLLARAKIAAAGSDYLAAFRALADLRPAVDRFFDELLVMADDPVVRSLRLALLASVADLMSGIADLGKIVE